MRHVDSCNDLVSAQKHGPRDGETNRLRGPLVDDQPALRLLVGLIVGGSVAGVKRRFSALTGRSAPTEPAPVSSCGAEARPTSSRRLASNRNWTHAVTAENAVARRKFPIKWQVRAVFPPP